MDDRSATILSIAAPAMLLGAALFLMRPRDDELGAPQLPSGSRPRGRTPGFSMGGRHAARKLYGSAVLSAQAAASMRRLAVDTHSRPIAMEARALQQVSRRLLERATSLDPAFVRSKLT